MRHHCGRVLLAYGTDGLVIGAVSNVAGPAASAELGALVDCGGRRKGRRVRKWMDEKKWVGSLMLIFIFKW